MASPNPNNPYAHLKLQSHTLDQPPMPWKQYRDKQYREFGRMLAIVGFILLLAYLGYEAGIVLTDGAL